jgi:hypothetical protein
MRHLVLGFMGSALLFAVACGGKVVVEAGGTGGGGGSDITTTGSVSPAGQVSAVSSSTGGASLCQQACSVIQANGCGESGCVPDCQQSYATAGACAPLLDAVVFCYLNSPILDCSNPVECAEVIKNYTNCVQPEDCGPGDCSVSSDGSCSCSSKCNGSALEVQCSPGNATDFCLCLKDGTPIGKCTQPQSGGPTCDIFGGCCATVFFP